MTDSYDESRAEARNEKFELSCTKSKTETKHALTAEAPHMLTADPKLDTRRTLKDDAKQVNCNIEQPDATRATWRRLTADPSAIQLKIDARETDARATERIDNVEPIVAVSSSDRESPIRISRSLAGRSPFANMEKPPAAFVITRIEKEEDKVAKLNNDAVTEERANDLRDNDDPSQTAPKTERA
jgi:hypothetical protein